MRFAAHDSRLRVLEARTARANMVIKIVGGLPPDGAPASPAPVAIKTEGGVPGFECASMASCESTDDPAVAKAQSRWLGHDPQVKRQREYMERAQAAIDAKKGL
jgi:hypothetical protein